MMLELGAGPAMATRDRHVVNTDTIIRARSPLRISFGGGGTDLPHYYSVHGGAVLSSTINRYAYVSLKRRCDNAIDIADSRGSTSYNLDHEPASDGITDLVRAAICRMGPKLGFSAYLASDAPRGSGLGGSSALTSALIGAIAEYTGIVLERDELAELNFIIERLDLGIAGGKQDQYATAYGGFNLIEFSRDRVLVTPLRLSPDTMNDLECHLLLCYTGKVRPSLGIVEQRIRGYNEGQEAVLEYMRRLYAMAFEMKNTLLRRRIQDFGALLHESMVEKRRINASVSDPKIDELYELARRHGALGGKLLGAGGGGYLLLFVPMSKIPVLTEKLEGAGGQVSRFSFESAGMQVWRSRCE